MVTLTYHPPDGCNVLISYQSMKQEKQIFVCLDPTFLFLFIIYLFIFNFLFWQPKNNNFTISEFVVYDQVLFLKKLTNLTQKN
jgi:hypothetical protein